MGCKKIVEKRDGCRNKGNNERKYFLIIFTEKKDNCSA